MASPRLNGSATTIEVAQPQPRNQLPDMLRRLAAASGRPLTALLQDFLKASFGPGKLSFDEYVALGLYDSGRYAGADIRAFAGLSATQRIWRRANYRMEFDGLVGNKIAMTALLAAYGFPVIPIAALTTTAAGYATERTLRTRDQVRAFLADTTHYPLFGKPVAGYQSLGSASFSAYDPAEGALLGYGGSRIPIDAYVDDVVAHFGGGYLFQPRRSPHAGTRAICGERLATVRVVTLFGQAGPKIWRTCEKIPAGMNVADNYWRSGNLLVQLDIATGMRGRAISGKGFDLVEHTHHPDSGAPIAGTVVPNWSVVCELALEAARVVKDTALMGWDIAPVDGGAVVVEANAMPDLMLPQLADRRGILDTELTAFLEGRRQSEVRWKREVRAAGWQMHRASFLG